MFLAGLGARIGFTALYESRICTIGSWARSQGFVKDPSRARWCPSAKVTVQQRMLAWNVSVHDQRLRLLHRHQHSARLIRDSRWKSPASRSTKAADNKLDPSASLAVGHHADGRRRHGNRGSLGDRRGPADRIRLRAEARHPRADRCARTERTQPHLHGEPGPRHARRQPRRPFLQLQPGSEQHQRRAHRRRA